MKNVDFSKRALSVLEKKCQFLKALKISDMAKEFNFFGHCKRFHCAEKFIKRAQIDDLDKDKKVF